MEARPVPPRQSRYFDGYTTCSRYGSGWRLRELPRTETGDRSPETSLLDGVAVLINRLPLLVPV
jgi:hypothetical protein